MTIIGGGTREDRIKHAEAVGDRLKQLIVDATYRGEAWLVRNLDMDRKVAFPGKDVIITIFDLATPAIGSHFVVERWRVNEPLDAKDNREE